MTNADILGRFVWHELMTTDAEAASEFYAQVTGWEAQSWEKDPSYTLWMTPDGPMGGAMALPSDDDDEDASPHWLPYIGTSDIDATVEAAQRLGGRVERDISDVASIGKFAILSDPQGAMFAVLEPESGTGSGAKSDGAAQLGGFSWHELATTDYDAAFQFYQELFGWQKDSVDDMGGGMTYLLFSHNGTQIGGMYNKSPDSSAPANWLCYVRVKGAEEAVDAAKSAGGQVVSGPMEVPGGSLVAQIIDPQGAAFAVHEQRQSAESAKPSKPKRSGSKKKKPAAEPVAAAEAAPMAATASSSMDDDEEGEAAIAEAPAEEKAAKPAAAKKSKGAAKPAAKKAGKKKAPAKKAAGKKAPAKKAAARKAPAKKAAAKKGKKAAKKSGATRSAVGRKSASGGGRSAQLSRAKSAASVRSAGSKRAAKKSPARKK